MSLKEFFKSNLIKILILLLLSISLSTGNLVRAEVAHEPCPAEAVVNPETMECRVETFCDERGGWYPEGWFHLKGAWIDSCPVVRCALSNGVFYGSYYTKRYLKESLKCDINGCIVTEENITSERCVCPEGLQFSSCLGCVNSERFNSIPHFYHPNETTCIADEIRGWIELNFSFICGASNLDDIFVTVATGFKDHGIDTRVGSFLEENYTFYYDIEKTGEPGVISKFTIKNFTVKNITQYGVGIPVKNGSKFCFQKDYCRDGGCSGECTICTIKNSEKCEIECAGEIERKSACYYYCTPDMPHLMVVFSDEGFWEEVERRKMMDRLTFWVFIGIVIFMVLLVTAFVIKKYKSSRVRKE